MANEEFNEELTEENMAELMQIVVEDSTNWDLMTGAELNKRLKAHKKGESFTNTMRLFSCLRQVALTVLVNEDGDDWATPVYEAEGEKMIPVFSTPAKIKNEEAKAYKREKMYLAEVLDAFDDEDITGIVLNPDTDGFYVNIDMLDKLYRHFDEIERMYDSRLYEGVSGEDINDMEFARLGGRYVAVDLYDGRHFEGLVCCLAGNPDLPHTETTMDIEADNGETVSFTRADLKFVKDIEDEHFGDEDE